MSNPIMFTLDMYPIFQHKKINVIYIETNHLPVVYFIAYTKNIFPC